MDALFIIKEITELKHKKLLEKKEEFTEDINYQKINIIGYILVITIGIYAAYLSYTCNSKENVNDVLKVIYAILAYIFGLFYLLYYFLFRNEHCSTL